MKNSKRNRHTGHINAFKQRVIDKGERTITANGRVYFRHFVKSGFTIVRTH